MEAEHRRRRLQAERDRLADATDLMQIDATEYERRISHWNASATKLRTLIASTTSSPFDKHHAVAEHALTSSRTLFTCGGCWLYAKYCICSRLTPLNLKTRLRIHIVCHHKEYARTTSTAILAATKLGSSCDILLRGYRPHDATLAALCAQKSTIILWPAEGSGNAVSCEEVRALLECSPPLHVLVIDGTWSAARKINGKLDPDIPRLSLPPSEQHSGALAPVRRYRGGRVSRNYCTLEAIGALMCAMGEPDVAQSLRAALELKVAKCLEMNYRGREGRRDGSHIGSDDDISRS